MMQTAIHYKRHTPELSEGFYHPDCPVLYAEHDTIGRLEDCPFPLKTETFEVLLFGTSKTFPMQDKKYGDTRTFAVVDWTKACGHKVQCRVPFAENVETFDHYGTVFTGESYSIKAWEKRMEFFRGYPCDVCAMIKHGVWHWRGGTSNMGNSCAEITKAYLQLLDYNFDNWREFVSEASVTRRFGRGPWLNSDEKHNEFTAHHV